MIDIRLRIALVVIMLLSVIAVIRISKKAKMEVKDAANWIIFSLCLLLVAIFPEIVATVASLVGITLASNAAFALVLFTLIVIVFYLNIRISRLSLRTKDLVQKIGLLEKSIRDSEGK